MTEEQLNENYYLTNFMKRLKTVAEFNLLTC